MRYLGWVEGWLSPKWILLCGMTRSRAVKIATLCARRVVTSSSPRSTRWPTEVKFRRSSRRRSHPPQRSSYGERRPALRRQSARRFEAPGPRRASSRARCDAPTTVLFSLREVCQETQIRGKTTRLQCVATLRAKPCSMDETRERSSGQIGRSAHVQRALESSREA